MRFRDRLKAIGYEDYNSYLESDHWKGKRREFLKDKCFCCQATARLQLHHKTYKRLGNESEHDFVTVCRSCHILIHELVKSRRSSLGKAHLRIKDSVSPEPRPAKVRKPEVEPRPKKIRCANRKCRHKTKDQNNFCKKCRKTMPTVQMKAAEALAKKSGRLEKPKHKKCKMPRCNYAAGRYEIFCGYCKKLPESKLLQKRWADAEAGWKIIMERKAASDAAEREAFGTRLVS